MVTAISGLFYLATLAAPASADGWQPLFDGKTLDGWKASENPASFKVVDGAIVTDGPRAHLFYAGQDGAASFRNFELSAEIRTRPGANSGVYFHTAFQDSGFPRQGFEVQVNNSHVGDEGYVENKKTASLYGIRNVFKAPAKDDEWFTMNIVVRGNRVQIGVNGTPLVDYVEPANAADLRIKRFSKGTFALQCHDPKSRVLFRNLRARRLPDDVENAPPVTFDEVDAGLLRLQRGNYPVVDFHAHLKGGLTLEQVLERTLKTGVNYGLAINCGLGFPVTDDKAAEEALRSTQGKPVFVAMQAEGREWVKMFSPATIAKFDYVFTDSMTIIDHRGQRARLWIKEEVDIPDRQAFMELLTQTTVNILEKEPIDIYVNPTYLPDVIAGEYDQLWTTERTQKIIDAAARNGVAIEISNKLQLPKADFIRRAQKAGVKFTLGTNNADPNLGRLEYGLRMVRECRLQWQDFWIPKPDGKKPIQTRGK